MEKVIDIQVDFNVIVKTAECSALEKTNGGQITWQKYLQVNRNLVSV